MPRDPVGGVVRNLLDLQRLGNAVNLEVGGIVEALFDGVAAEVARIDPTAPERSAFRQQRLERLLGEVDSLVGKSISEVRRTLLTRLAEIGVQQAEWAEGQLGRALGSVSIDTRSGRISRTMMRSILTNDPFEGATLGQWVDGLEGRLTNKKVGSIRRQIQAGMAGNETLDQIVRRIRGRSAGGGRFVGGVLQTTTRQAEAIARTGVNFIANRGHLATYQENADVLKGMEITAVLDRRTTEICMSLDGRVVDVDDPDPKLIPPFHWRCRTVLTPVVDWEGLGLEPPAEGTRASEFGQVPSSQTYEEFLKGQTNAYQDDVLGPARAKLFREGRIDLQGLVRTDRSLVTVDDLRKRAPPAPAPSVSRQKLAAVLKGEDDAIAAEPLEHAVVVDPATGEVIYRKTSGRKSEVAFTLEEVNLAKDRILTHNHPRNSSFSREDVSFAINNDLAEIRAVGTRFRYRLVRPDGGWEAFQEVAARVRSAEARVRKESRALVQGGELTSDESAIQHFHKVWSLVFHGTPTRYIRRSMKEE